jgi:predicted RNA-binding Zn-ribbon protein involved in translation (DUF1610 family)
MHKLYKCPSCESVLNPVKEIVLSGRLGRQRTLFLFQPELGDYNFATAPGTDVVPGDTWEFHCPVCQHNITTRFSRSLAELNLEEGDGERRVVVFSKVANQHASFEVTKSGVQGFGEHKDAYFDAFVDDHYW